MAGNIRINPEHVRQVANTFKQQGDASRQMINILQTAVQGLEADFEGMTQQAFFQEFTQWKTTMDQFAQHLDGISIELNNIATRFEQADAARTGI